MKAKTYRSSDFLGPQNLSSFGIEITPTLTLGLEEFNFIDIIGQGDRLVKHWNFKGTHDGEMFGIPPTNNKVDISGTTVVLIKDGKVLQEQDFFDNHSFLSQLGLL